MNDKNLREIFTAHKMDVPDDGFSEHIIKKLPERKSILPQIIMVTCITIGLVLTLAIHGIIPILNNINALITSISHAQIPQASSFFTYLCILSLMGIITYSIIEVDAG